MRKIILLAALMTAVILTVYFEAVVLFGMEPNDAAVISVAFPAAFVLIFIFISPSRVIVATAAVASIAVVTSFVTAFDQVPVIVVAFVFVAFAAFVVAKEESVAYRKVLLIYLIHGAITAGPIWLHLHGGG